MVENTDHVSAWGVDLLAIAGYSFPGTSYDLQCLSVSLSSSLIRALELRCVLCLHSWGRYIVTCTRLGVLLLPWALQ